ncbi:hypothetical protein TWF102_006517 [Orbilia oligospora]|uniref:Uncharacterized protein n=1 Tax=Orbilia oligospora TaxID=2813651 RepID=A0A7C8NC69_ORBOL|nr:hypothetical protein TWF102_006517 [Orbilia oligospora]
MSKRKATAESLTSEEIQTRKKNVEKVLSWRNNLTGWAKEELRLKNNWSSKKSLQKNRLHKKSAYVNGSREEKKALDLKWEETYSEVKLQEFLADQKKKYEETHGTVPPKTRGWSTVEKRLGKRFNPYEEIQSFSYFPVLIPEGPGHDELRSISDTRSRAWLSRWEKRAKKENELEEEELDIEDDDEWEDIEE